MTTMNAAQAIMEVLKAEGVKFIFGLIGGHTVPLYDALHGTPEIQHIMARHEQSAANMAAGYTQLTGEPGICCATAGPGATNIVTGIAEAYFGALPVIILAGRGMTGTRHRGAAQEMDHEKMFEPITKWAIRVDRADKVVEIMRRAFTIARSGKPGPVLVDLPVDIQMGQVEFDGYMPVGRPAAPRGDASLVNAAVDKLYSSKRPIIVAGGGTVASGAFSELREAAEAFGAPVLTSLSGRGSLPDDHPLAGGGLGFHRTEVSRDLLVQADFVLGLGCRFGEMETSWKPGWVPAPDAFYVQVDTDPAEMGKGIIPNIGIVSDIKMLLHDMMSVAKDTGKPVHGKDFSTLPRIKELLKRKEVQEKAIEAQAVASTKETPMSALRVITKIRQVFGREATVAIDIGCLTQAWGGAYPHFKVFEPRSCIVCTSFYAMGYAASALPVAKLVYPARPAVAIVGDGSFAQVMNQLLVAADHHLPVTWIIINNYRLGSIKPTEEESPKPYIPIPSELDVQADFKLVAEACHCYGEKVEDASEIDVALGRALTANNRGIPAVLDFAVKREWAQSAWDFIGSVLGG